MEYTTSNDGTSIAFERTGTGPPLLFVHGTTADRHSWYRVTPPLAEHFTVYAMDRRGRGGSGDGPGYSLAREAEDVAAVVAAAAGATGQPVALFGHSFGGLCCLEAALLTDQVERLILYEPAIPPAGLISPPGMDERLQALIDRNELEAAMELFLREVARLPEHELEFYRRSPLWEPRLPLARTLPREIEVEATYRFESQRFTGLQTPTLLLLGGDSPPESRDAVALVAATLSDSRVVVLPGQQHIAHHTATDLLIKELQRFLLH